MVIAGNIFYDSLDELKAVILKDRKLFKDDYNYLLDKCIFLYESFPILKNNETTLYIYTLLKDRNIDSMFAIHYDENIQN